MSSSTKFNRASLLTAHNAIMDFVKSELDEGFKTAVKSVGKYKVKADSDPFWLQSSIHDIVAKTGLLTSFKTDQKTLKAIVIFLVKGENIKMPDWGKLSAYGIKSVEEEMTTFIPSHCADIDPSHPIKCVKWVDVDPIGKKVGNLRLRVNFDRGAVPAPASAASGFFETPEVPSNGPSVSLELFRSLQKQVAELAERLENASTDEFPEGVEELME